MTHLWRIEMEEKQLPTKYNFGDLNLELPQNQNLEKDEIDKINNEIINNGIIDGKGRAFIDQKALPTILSTDKKGATKVYVNANPNDKAQYGNNKYLSVSETQKQICERKQEPRDILTQEKLKQSEASLKAIIEAPQLEKERQLEAERINRDRGLLTAKKMKENNITTDQLTGKELKKPRGHHIERVADNPREARNLDNIVIVEDDIHDDIHQNNAESKEKLKEYCEKNNFNIPDELK
jgi:hypothetical protein